MAKTNYVSVREYIRARPKSSHAVLERVRAALKKALPGATEGISYQIPVYKLDGQMVLYFAGFAGHYSIYPATPRLLAVLGKELVGVHHHKATLRFALDEPVPTALITRIAKIRAAEAAERAAAKAKKAPKSAKKKTAKRAGASTARKPPRKPARR